ncbi:hypothetical protein Tco_0958806 [Tanacetum coccineum]
MASQSASDSATTGAGSTSAPTIREIIPTNRTPEVWRKQYLNTESGDKRRCGRDGQNFHVHPDYLREQIRLGFEGVTFQNATVILSGVYYPTSPLVIGLVSRNEATQLTDQEIALDASSDGSLSSGERRRDYMMSSGAEDDQTGEGGALGKPGDEWNGSGRGGFVTYSVRVKMQEKYYLQGNNMIRRFEGGYLMEIGVWIKGERQGLGRGGCVWEQTLRLVVYLCSVVVKVEGV